MLLCDLEREGESFDKPVSALLLHDQVANV
jgi:hypothetical protein